MILNLESFSLQVPLQPAFHVLQHLLAPWFIEYLMVKALVALQRLV
jgi:hypothetical protein